MIQGGSGPGLPPEAVQGFLIASQLIRQKLQSNESLEPRILCFVDHPHAAARPTSRGCGNERTWRRVRCLCCSAAAPRLLRPLPPRGPPGTFQPAGRTSAATGLRAPAPRRRRRRSAENRRAPRAAAPAPTAAALSTCFHRSESIGGLPRSVRGRARAWPPLQSRFTVIGDTLSTSAVSSTLSPPKKRISMTCIFADRAAPGRSAHRPAPPGPSCSSPLKMAASSRETCWTSPPPRFRLCRRA